MKEHKKQVIRNLLEEFEFYIWNNDWEFSEKNYEKVVYELYESIEEEKPDDIYHYVKDFLIKNYPFHWEYK